MPYLATRRFKVIPKGTDHTIEYKPGDAVLDFESWPDHAQRAHINQGIVKAVDFIPDRPGDKPEAETAPKPKRGRKAKEFEPTGDVPPPFIRTREHEEAEERHLPPAVLK